MTLDEVFAVLEQAALTGSRCPQGDVIPAKLVRELARQRRIRIEISGLNWRVVTLLTGEHAGKKTAPDPRGVKPYRTIEGDRDYWHSRGAAARRSAPVTLPFKDGRRVP